MGAFALKFGWTEMPTPTAQTAAAVTRTAVAPALLILSLAAAPAAHAVDVVRPPSGSVTLSNPGLFLQKNVGDSISWAGNSIVNYRNTSAAATDHDGVKESACRRSRTREKNRCNERPTSVAQEGRSEARRPATSPAGRADASLVSRRVRGDGARRLRPPRLVGESRPRHALTASVRVASSPPVASPAPAGALSGAVVRWPSP